MKIQVSTVSIAIPFLRGKTFVKLLHKRCSQPELFFNLNLLHGSGKTGIMNPWVPLVLLAACQHTKLTSQQMSFIYLRGGLQRVTLTHCAHSCN